MLERLLSLLLFITFFANNIVLAQNATEFDTKWIPSKPEVLTYHTTSTQGDGFYQTVIVKNIDNNIEVLVHMMTPGFAKTLSGFMTVDVIPLFSTGKIFIGEQVQMNNETRYESGHLSVTTVVKPYNKILQKDTTVTGRVIDPSQIPFLARFLQLNKNVVFEFNSLNPQTNMIYHLTMKVTGEETIQNVDCYKVEWKDFEGKVICWVEKANRHRPIRIEQPEKNRITEIVFK